MAQGPLCKPPGMQRPGARCGTLVGRSAGDAPDRTAEVNGLVLSPDFANDVSTTETSYQGVATPEVTLRGPLADARPDRAAQSLE
jgi:hypothetical protein